MERPTGPEEFESVHLPNRKEFEIFAIVTKMHGTDQIRAICEDGIERGCRITGKMKKKVWIRLNDVIIVKVWDFQPSKGDVVWRYLGGQKNWLDRKGYLNKLKEHTSL